MSRPICLQIYVSRELGARIRAVAHARELDISAFARSLLAAACDASDAGTITSPNDDRAARQNVFVMVGVDALLAGHSDPRLRERAHRAYARKCEELGLNSASVEGGAA
jgi:post-segregation antitoxin (ccd killing protein)